MTFFLLSKSLRLFIQLPFAIFILLLLAIVSSIGSILEQNESISFYQQNYSSHAPFYGLLNDKVILALGLDHLFESWWFFLLLFTLFLSLSGCTFIRQLPLFARSKVFLFKHRKQTFGHLPFFAQRKESVYGKESLSSTLYALKFALYQKENVLYAYKGLLGRISPIFVHFSLIIILMTSSIAALKGFKVQELLPKGELIHIQNAIQNGSFAFFPSMTVRANDFWVEYNQAKIKQFYSNLSSLYPSGVEIKEQTISVNNPFRQKQIDFYQGDWNVLALRLENIDTQQTKEFPLFSLQKESKSWIAFLPDSEQIALLDQIQNTLFLYNRDGIFISESTVGDFITPEVIITDILPATGLFIKHDPTISLLYFGLALLMGTTSFSYFPYTQIWVLDQKEKLWLGGLTNRGKTQLEIQLIYLAKKKYAPFFSF